MRVIAGEFKGRRLAALKGNRIVRPTADRVKESVFSILGQRIVDGSFLDLCAGTGNIGIEALSRGAKHVTFLERDPRCQQVIERNLRTCNPCLALCLQSDKQYLASRHPQVQLLRCDVVKGIAYLRKRLAVFDIIYFDPPYNAGFSENVRVKARVSLYDVCLEQLAKVPLLSANGTLLVEHAKQRVLPDTVGELTRSRRERYGDTVLSFYQMRGEPN